MRDVRMRIVAQQFPWPQNNCPTTSCTRPGALAFAIRPRGLGQVMASVRMIGESLSLFPLHLDQVLNGSLQIIDIDLNANL